MEGASKVKEISPSILPKLAECSLFENGEGGDKTAANRGTNIDIAIRKVVWQCQFDPIVNLEKTAHKTLKDILGDEPSEEDCASVIWGAQELLRLADGEIVETREESLAMGVPRLSKMGTADGGCWPKKWVADIKTGQARNYREQLGAYSLACMRDHFEDTWTAHVIYVDQRFTRTYYFAKEETERMLERILDEATRAEAKPTPCEYCSWCKHYNSCNAIVRQAKDALDLIPAQGGETLDQIKERILSSNGTLSAFAQNWKLAEKVIAEPALAELKTRLEGGAEIDGWQIVEVNGREFADKRTILSLIKENNLSMDDVVTSFGGKMSGEKFRELAAKAGAQAPELPRGKETKQLRQIKTKK